MKVELLKKFGWAAGGGDLQFPRKIRRQAEGLGIKEISPAANRLAKGHGGHQHIEQLPEGLPAPAAEQHRGQGAAQQGTVDGDASTPNRDRF